MPSIQLYGYEIQALLGLDLYYSGGPEERTVRPSSDEERRHLRDVLGRIGKLREIQRSRTGDLRPSEWQAMLERSAELELPSSDVEVLVQMMERCLGVLDASAVAPWMPDATYAQAKLLLERLRRSGT